MVEVLVAAHLDYEWERWLLPGPERAPVLRQLLRADLSLIAMPTGATWVAGEDGLDAVAVWTPPRTRPEAAAVRTVHALAVAALGGRRRIVEEVEATIAAHRPPLPHWFLSTMGTRPSHQRRGLGTAVLRPVLERLDTAGMAACCETSSEANVSFYETLGFEPVAELVSLPDAAPPTWVLWRPAASTSVRTRTGR